MSSDKINEGPNESLGNNQMLLADPDTGDVHRFLVGPKRCEVTGVAATPDGKTMFINIQHPGEPDRGPSDPNVPLSNWPSGKAGDRPRSATLVLRHKDGRVIGS